MLIYVQAQSSLFQLCHWYIFFSKSLYHKCKIDHITQVKVRPQHRALPCTLSLYIKPFLHRGFVNFLYMCKATGFENPLSIENLQSSLSVGALQSPLCIGTLCGPLCAKPPLSRGSIKLIEASQIPLCTGVLQSSLSLGAFQSPFCIGKSLVCVNLPLCRGIMMLLGVSQIPISIEGF